MASRRIYDAIFVNPEAMVNRDIPNMALAYAATHFNTKVIDQNTIPCPKDRFLRYEARVLGISIQSRTYGEARRIAGSYKAKYPDAQIKSISGFLDVQCCYPYLDLDDKIEYRETFSDNFPFPDYELFDSFRMFKDNWQKGGWSYAIMTSQGCPYQCIYCVSRNRPWRSRSAGNCYEELRLAREKWAIRSFQILDDCFNIDRNRVMEFCDLVKPLGLGWSCANGVRADRFDEEMAKAMREAGCKHISLGVESAVPEVLKAVNKGETIDDIERAVNTAKRYFGGVNGFFIIGLPGSSYEKDLSSLQWAKDRGINAHFSYYVPFDKAMEYDRLFYGEKAEPLSDEYPRELQKKIYEMTKDMRPRQAKEHRPAWNLGGLKGLLEKIGL